MEFDVECSKCFKWLYIPTEERYEKIREHLLECPLYCEDAREWRPSISCNDIPDITRKEKKYGHLISLVFLSLIQDGNEL
uniref:CW-type domain-containing protein n=1 Tax=Solanum lycopersicum TaxID=4081 RepID=A0A3Q7ICT4_SOLLC